MRWLQKGAAPDADGFHDTAVSPADLQSDQMTAVTINGEAIILTRWRESVVAFSRYCPHAAGDLSQGRLRRGRITCPDHSYQFDLETGRPTWPEDEVCRLKRFAVRESDGTVRVKLT